jgi:hypothetical protein
MDGRVIDARRRAATTLYGGTGRRRGLSRRPLLLGARRGFRSVSRLGVLTGSWFWNVYRDRRQSLLRVSKVNNRKSSGRSYTREYKAGRWNVLHPQPPKLLKRLHLDGGTAMYRNKYDALFHYFLNRTIYLRWSSGWWNFRGAFARRRAGGGGPSRPGTPARSGEILK